MIIILKQVQENKTKINKNFIKRIKKKKKTAKKENIY